MTQDPSADDPIAQSLDLLAARCGDPSAQVYARLFDVLPQTRELFARDTTGAIRGEMLAMAFQCMLEPEGSYSANLIRTERVNHEAWGVTPDLYVRFFRVVQETCRSLLGADWTPAYEAAWSARIARLDEIMAQPA